MEPEKAPTAGSDPRPSNPPRSPGSLPPALRRLAVAAAVLSLVCALPLWDWVRFALSSDLFSHTILIPVISGYFIWQRRGSLTFPGTPDPAAAAVFLLPALAGLGVYTWMLVTSASFPREDRLALAIASYFAGLVGLGTWILGRGMLRQLTFPLAFLAFAPPLPVAATDAIETFLQHGSAEVVSWIFTAAGTPVYREGLIFQLPGITLRVAQECSGIHSTLALFITSVVASFLFLRRPALRLLLVAAVIPLALLRNGFRVFVIGELCVRVSPDMIHSFIHRQGGPIFFALSLVPFSLLLYLLHRFDRKSPHPELPPAA